MRLVTYRANIEAAARLGAVVDEEVVDVERIGVHAGVPGLLRQLREELAPDAQRGRLIIGAQ